MERTLKAFGIETCADLEANLVYLQKMFTPTTFEFLFNAALGVSASYFGA